MKNAKKIFLLLIIAIIVFSSCGNIVKAEDGVAVSAGDGGGTGGGDGGGGGGGGGGGRPANCSCSVSGCIASYGLRRRDYKAQWEIYDVYNNDVEITGQSIIAGTQLGFNLHEERKTYWYATGATQYSCTCWYFEMVAYDCTGDHGEAWICYTPIKHTYPSGYVGNTTGCYNQNADAAYYLAKSDVESGASYSLTIPDPNDARCADPVKYKEELERDNVICNNYTNVEAIPGETSKYRTNPVTKKYYYEMYGSCINVKTGKVRYLSKDDKCNDEEYYIAKDEENEATRHWHVFTPLNTKTPSGYALTLDGKSKGTKQKGNLCEAIVEKYKENYKYMRYIIPLTGSFTRNVTADKKKVLNGCYMQTLVSIPTIQKFYGEEINDAGDDSTLIGFQFYYRQIDITNPFPNGIANDSYWKDWEDNKKDPDIEKSYNNVTYQTDGIDLSYIRDYNDKNNYTSWKTMNINGTSPFITSGKIVSRSSTINQQSLYNLGCGPTNMCEYYIDSSGNKKKNPIYQPECANTRKEVSCP